MTEKHTGPTRRAGFTLIETLFVVGLLATLFAITVPVTFDFYVQYQLRSERENFLALLRESRNRALVGRNASSHGLFIASGSYTLFQGPSYASRSTAQDQTFSKPAAVSITGPSEVTFQRLSGTVSSASFSVTSTEAAFTVSINSQGMIDWNVSP